MKIKKGIFGELVFCSKSRAGSAENGLNIAQRFQFVDPISDKFPWVSTYNYAENEPIANIDLHGLQKVRYAHQEFQARVKNFSDRVESKIVNSSNSVKAGLNTVKNKINQVGNYLYDNVVGNDDIGNVVDAVEQTTEGRSGEIMEKITKGAGNLGTVGDVAEGLKIMNEGINADTPEKEEAAAQDAVKLTVEVAISVGAPAVSIPANILINNSKDSGSVAHPANIDRAAGAFESSLNQNKSMIQQRIERRKKEASNN